MTDGFNDEELIESLRLWNRDDAAARIEQLVATNEALTADLARSTRMIAKMVPLSADGNYVFWDGVGDIELDHNGELRKIIEALSAKLATCEKYRDAYAEMDRIGTQAVRDLEAKLEKAVEALKCWNSMMQNEAYDLGEMVCEFDLIARATLAEIKLQSSEFATQKGESHD